MAELFQREGFHFGVRNVFALHLVSCWSHSAGLRVVPFLADWITVSVISVCLAVPSTLCQHTGLHQQKCSPFFLPGIILMYQQGITELQEDFRLLNFIHRWCPEKPGYIYYRYVLLYIIYIISLYFKNNHSLIQVVSKKMLAASIKERDQLLH